MRNALLGGLLIVAGIALRIIAHAHVPVAGSCGLGPVGGDINIPSTQSGCVKVGDVWTSATGWSPTLSDLAHVASWALIVFGVIVVVFAVIREIKGRTATA